jgi:hypothetical protein
VNILKICPALIYRCIIYQGLTCSLFYIAAITLAIILPNLIIKQKTAIDGMGILFCLFSHNEIGYVIIFNLITMGT